MPKYIVFNHHGKADAYIRALPGWNWFKQDESEPSYVDFVLTDQAILGRVNVLRQFRWHGTGCFFVYPHAARPNLVNDIVKEWEGITAQFVAAPGHVDVMRAYGYGKPLHVMGWHLCPIQPFQPRAEPRRVLFAPIHPRCADTDQDVNLATFHRLYKLVESGDIQLTVRYINDLAESGLSEQSHPNLCYTRGELLPDWSQIDQADVVISHQTFAWLAVARGIPTVMMAEDLPTHLMTNPVKYAKHWDVYHDLLAFPLDILASPPRDTLNLLRRAVKDDTEIADWKERMIGSPFDAELFVETLMSYLC